MVREKPRSHILCSLLADLAGSGLSTLCLGRTHTENHTGWGPISLTDSLQGIDFNTQKLKEHQMWTQVCALSHARLLIPHGNTVCYSSSLNRWQTIGKTISRSRLIFYQMPAWRRDSCHLWMNTPETEPRPWSTELPQTLSDGDPESGSISLPFCPLFLCSCVILLFLYYSKVSPLGVCATLTD